MIIKEPDPKVRTVSDLDFTFTNNVVMSYTIDEESGDSVEYPKPDAIVIHITARPNPDGLTYTPAEDITIYTRNLCTIEHRKRQVTDRTLAEQLEWQKTFQEMEVKTIQ